MSNILTKLAYRAQVGSGPVKSVLVRLCDFASDDGSCVYPSVPRIAADCELGQRTVQDALRKLETLQVLMLVKEADAGKRLAREYRIDVDVLAGLACPEEDRGRPRGAGAAPVQEPHRCESRTLPVQEPHPTGAGAAPSTTIVTTKTPADDAGARAPSQLVAVGMQVLRLIGVADDPRWFGNYGRVQQWLASGADPELDIYPTVQRLMAKRAGRGPPSSIDYFDGAIADAIATRTRPMPEGAPRDQHRQTTRQPRRNGWAVVAERHAESRVGGADDPRDG